MSNEKELWAVTQQVDRIAFGLFELDTKAGELWKGGHKVRLAGQPVKVLVTLLERPGEVVTREELQHQIWGTNTTVDFERALAGAINKVREALGDSAENPRFIQTLTKRGYRFIAPVSMMHTPASHVGAVPAQQVITGSEIATHLTGETPSNAANSVGDPLSTIPVLAVPEAVLKAEAQHNARDPGKDRDATATQVAAHAPKGSIGSDHAMLLRSVVFIAALGAGAFAEKLLAPTVPRPAPSRVDQVTHYVPISLGPPNPESFLSLAIDGDRVLTSVIVNGRPRLSAIDVDTGEVQGIELPDEIASNSLSDISKDGSKLLLRSQQSTESEQPLWVVPAVGGSARRVQGVLAHDAVWMPDGTGILFASGSELDVIGNNDDVTKIYAKLPGRAFWLRWSPNGKLLRFTLLDPVTHTAALWEMASGSHVSHALRIPGLEHISACCGVWLPDGQSYIFQANDNLWEIKGSGSRAVLLQLTNGPLRYLSPVAARSGNRVFFVGLEAPSGLQRLDPERKEFRPAPPFLAEANRIDFSRDGKWVAWTDIHEKLWRARVDGSDKVRLTADDLEVFLANWSPDGKRLAAMARKPGGVWQIYLVEASGSRADVLLDERRNAADPSWAADGGSLVFGREPDLMGKESGPRTLQVINLATNQTEEIPGSEDLFSPRWSPDGRWIVALTLDQKTVMLYDVAQRRWQRLATTSAADPVWSADSKAIYVHAFLADREPILRLEVPSGIVRTVADLGNLHNGEAANYFFGGTTRSGEPLVQPRIGTGNLYSLDLTTP